MVTELKEMMVERLLTYQKHSRRLPDRVYVYRDGVSEVRYLSLLRCTMLLTNNTHRANSTRFYTKNFLRSSKLSSAWTRKSARRPTGPSSPSSSAVNATMRGFIPPMPRMQTGMEIRVRELWLIRVSPRCTLPTPSLI